MCVCVCAREKELDEHGLSTTRMCMRLSVFGGQSRNNC